MRRGKMGRRETNRRSTTSLILTLGVFFYGLVGVRGQTSICERDLKRCMEPLQQFSNSKFASTAEQLDLVCPAMLDNIHCVEDFATQCMNMAERMALLQLFHGVGQVVQVLCTEGSFRQEYLRHAPCLWEDQAEYDRCASHYSTKARQAESVDVGQSQAQKEICCAFYNFLTCSKSIYTLKCGAETARFMERYLDMIAGPVIKESCAPYQHNRMCSAAPKSGVSGWLITNIILTAVATSFIIL